MIFKQPVVASLIIVSLFIAGCFDSSSPDVIEFSGQTMGTWYSVRVSHLPESVVPEQVANAISAELDNVNGKMSTYQSESEISQFNRLSSGAVFKVSKDTFDVLAQALNIWRLSRGAFDITVGPLVNVWGFGPAGRPGKIPSQTDMKMAWNRVGSDGLILHMDTLEVEKQKALSIDLSAIAKGYAVDRVALSLEALGIQRYLVEVGGEIRAGADKTDQVAWKVAVEEPITHGRQIHKIISLTNASMATSGDYRNYFEQDGKRYSHTIDPRNGMPIDHNLVSATVILPRCSEADAWATAIMALGPDQGMEVAELNKLPVYMILKVGSGFESRFSSAFANYLPL